MCRALEGGEGGESEILGSDNWSTAPFCAGLYAGLQPTLDGQ